MRLAKLKDFERRLKERAIDWPVKLKAFEFEDIPTVGTGEIQLSPLIVLAGPNGVGKTTILRALWAAADPDNAQLGPSTALKIRSGKARLTLVTDNREKTCEVAFSADTISPTTVLELDVLHLDAAFDSKDQQNTFCAFDSVEDIINGIGARVVSDKELAEINYISKREYREIKVYEIENNGRVTPFFELALGNDRYDSRTMGAGELALLFLWWSIERASDNGIVLIEEPETYLSPASQEAFSHFLLVSIVEKRLSVVLTSHSPKIIGTFPEEHVIFAFRDASGTRIVEGPAPPVLRDIIGLPTSVDVIALVEDEAGAAMLRHVLEQYNPSLSRRIEIRSRNGDGNVTTALKAMGGAYQATSIIGVYDGDIRGRVANEVEKFCAFLPGDKAIEVAFKEVVQANPEALSSATGSKAIAEILFSLQGCDHHDWYTRLCRELALTPSQMFPILFRIWHDVPSNAEEAKNCAEALLNLLKQLRE